MKGVFVGRLCPIHAGHEVVIRKLLDRCGFKDSLLILGSSNHGFSLRHFFSYRERRDFVESVFPGLRVVGLPDYPTDDEWLVALDDLLKLWGVDPAEAVFFGGCEEEVAWFMETGRRVEIVNRFDGSTPKISATEVRDALVKDRPLEALLNPLIHDRVKELFAEKWEKFKRM